MVAAESRLLGGEHRDDVAVEVTALARAAYDDPFRQWHVDRQQRRVADHHGLDGFGDEPVRDEPSGQVARQVVAARLPLEGRDVGVVSEVGHRLVDQPVERVARQAVEVAVGHEAAVVEDRPQQRPVTEHVLGASHLALPAELVVIGPEQVGVSHGREPSRGQMSQSSASMTVRGAQ